MGSVNDGKMGDENMSNRRRQMFYKKQERTYVSNFKFSIVRRAKLVNSFTRAYKNRGLVIYLLPVTQE